MRIGRYLMGWLCLCVILFPAIGRAELAQWAAAQEAAEHQIEWAALYGAEIDTGTQAEDITKRCKIKVSEGEKSKLTNGRVGSPWKYNHADAWIGIQLPDDVDAGAIRIEWMFDPVGYELIEYDASQNTLRTRTQDDTFPNICTIYPLLPEARMIRLKMTEKGQSVGRITVYSNGVLPADVQTWLPPEEKVDMMVFSTHQDDEVIFLGGTIPYSDVVCARPTITVYMTNCSRERRREALECLWEMGTRHYPEFINLEDEKVSSIEKGVKLWGGQDNILKEIVARIRRYKPEVIVTQDLDGEYGHNQHKIMARAMEPAIEAAADPSRFSESYNAYGAWQVKKLYLHLYKENQLRMDWLTPQAACGGLSLLEVARNGMKKHASQTKYYTVKDGGEYDNALFGLAVTTVGPDVEKNDFFENIPRTSAGADSTEPDVVTESETKVQSPESSAVPEEQPEPEEKEPESVLETPEVVDFAPAATAEPPTEVPPADAAEVQKGGAAPVLLGIGAALAGAGAFILFGRAAHPAKGRGSKRRGKKTKKSGKPSRKASGISGKSGVSVGKGSVPRHMKSKMH